MSAPKVFCVEHFLASQIFLCTVNMQEQIEVLNLGGRAKRDFGFVP